MQKEHSVIEQTSRVPWSDSFFFLFFLQTWSKERIKTNYGVEAILELKEPFWVGTKEENSNEMNG